MSLPVVLTDDAGADFDIAVDRYEQRAGLGVEFIDEVRAVLTRISQTPGMHRVVHRGVRRALVRRFPYLVFYRVGDDRVEVIAITHGHGDPSDWKKRV